MRTKNFTLIIIIFLISILMALLTQCISINKEDQFKIGVLVDQTGPLAIYGQWTTQGIDIAYDEIKANGKKIDLIIEDGQSDPKIAVSAVQKLINVDKILVLIGGNTSSSAIMAMAPITEKNKVIMFVTVGSSPSISTAGDFVFRNRISGDAEINKIADVVKTQLEIHNIVLAALNNEAGHAYAEFFMNAAKKYGLKIIAKEWVDVGKTDFRTLASKLKNTNAPAIFYAGSVREGAMLMVACKQMGYKPQWLGVSSMRSDELLKIAGDVAEGFLIATEFPDINSNKYRLFAEKYKEKFGEEPNTYSVNSYDALNFLTSAIDSVSYNPIKIRDFLYSHSFSGAGGEMKFDKNGDAIRKVQLMQVKDLEFVLIEN